MSCLTTVQARGAFSAARFLQAAATAGQRTGRLTAQLATPGTPCCSTHRSLISRGRGGRQAGLKLWRARSRLYQRRFLQPKHHFSAFFKSYKIITPSQRCKFKILRFFQFFRKILRFSKILQNFAEIKLKSVIFHRNLCRILSELLGNLRKLPDVSAYSKKNQKL